MGEDEKMFRTIEGVRYEVIIPKEEILTRVKEIGEQISNDYRENSERKLIFAGVLTGGVIFLSDLARETKHPRLHLDTIGLSSYGDGKISNREPRITSDLKNSICGEDLIIVEDIVDTGYSMGRLFEILQARGANSIRVAALLSKPERREIEVPVDYLGFEIPDHFVMGYGLDSGGIGRGWKDIVVPVKD